MANLKVYHRILIHDKNGNLIKRTQWRKSRSFVIQFLEILYGQFDETNPTVTDIGGVDRTVKWDAGTRMKVDAAAGIDHHGIVVGTGTTPPTNEDCALELQIPHGTASGQLDYASCSISVPAVVGVNVDMVVSRTFTNSSPASITVYEIGIYCRAVDITPADRSFMFIRDVLPSPETIPVASTLTVQYILRTTV